MTIESTALIIELKKIFSDIISFFLSSYVCSLSDLQLIFIFLEISFHFSWTNISLVKNSLVNLNFIIFSVIQFFEKWEFHVCNGFSDSCSTILPNYIDILLKLTNRDIRYNYYGLKHYQKNNPICYIICP